MEEKTFLENDDQFVISYELLHILQWLLKYEKKSLTRLIQQSFIKGIESSKATGDIYEEIQESESLQNSVVDFFSFLEKQVNVLSNTESTKHIMDKNLLEALDHIDSKVFDPAVIKASMMSTAEKVTSPKNIHTKELFLKELLKKWKPKKDKNNKHSFN